MNLRLPIVLCIAGVAGATALGRSLHASAPTGGAAAFSQSDAGEAARSPAPRRVRPAGQSGLVVYVAGAVARGGVYRVAPNARAVDALRAAGGATSTADLVAVNLAAPLGDGDEVIVPEKGATGDVAATDGGTTSHHKKRKRHRKKGRKRSHHRATQQADASAGDDSAQESADSTDIIGDAAPAAPIDLNTADASVLETLPGVGTKLAERIVTYRELNGPFAAHDDLLDVGGMTQKRLDAIEPFLLPL